MVTLRKIAEACGVSLATVSKALNDAPDLSKATKERIQNAAKTMGYLPNVAAKALRTSRSFSFGIIYEEAAKYGLTHEFFSRILNSFMRSAQTLGYDVFFLSDQLGGKPISYASHARYRNSDGILIIAGTDMVANVVEGLRPDKCPVVCIDFEFEGVSSVVSDNARGIKDLVDYIYGLGHRKIAFVYGDDTHVTRCRVSAFQACCEALGIALPREYLVPSAYHEPQHAQAAVSRLLDLPDPPTCILLPDDISYFGALNELNARGLRTPEDISVAGYDGYTAMQYAHPHLTTLRQDAEEMGVKAAALLARQADAGRPSQPEHISVSGHLIPGETVGRIK